MGRDEHPPRQSCAASRVPQWFTGNDTGANLEQLTTLKQQIDTGTATATADQARQLAILAHFDAARAQALSIIASLGVILTMLIQPLVGVAFDSTRSRMGRRAPWILFGTLAGAVLPRRPSLCADNRSPCHPLDARAGVAQHVLRTPRTILADRMPENRRGTASALGGLGNFFGGVLGGVSAGFLFGILGLDLYFIIAALVAFTGVMFVIFARDASSKDLDVPKLNWKKFLVGFTIALRSRNFRFVWVARILLTFGYAVSTALSLYMMQSYIRPALNAQVATQTAGLPLVGVPFIIIAVLVAGRLSDKLQKRRVFVVVSSGLMAASMLIPILSPTLPALFAQAIVGGIAFGTYLPVDQALFIDVLPDQKAAGRDLGVAALGSNLGQALGPALAGMVVAITGAYLGVWVAASYSSCWRQWP